MNAAAAISYARRVVDDELDELLPSLPAISLEGPKGVGKTETALRRAATVYRLDDAGVRELVVADPVRAARGPPTVLFDEWQRVPDIWDVVRRAVDAGSPPGNYLLTGSAPPRELPVHSGAGRIVTLRLRPLALAERGIESPTVSLGSILRGERPTIDGETGVGLETYAQEIVRSGFPGLRHLQGRALRLQLDSYIQRISEREFDELGIRIRNPATLRRWMTAYAAATSTAASYETIRDAATGGHGEKPAKSTTLPYRDALERLWVIEAVPAWAPSRNRVSRLVAPPKHQLADPALAARLLGLDAAALLDTDTSGRAIVRDGAMLGALFEALVTLDVRVHAQRSEASVGHLRTRGGEREIDLIVERGDGRVVAIEVKLARSVGDDDARNLRWLAGRIGDDLIDALIITTGRDAYRRRDGIAVVPAALLGP